MMATLEEWPAPPTLSIAGLRFAQKPGPSRRNVRHLPRPDAGTRTRHPADPGRGAVHAHHGLHDHDAARVAPDAGFLDHAGRVQLSRRRLWPDGGGFGFWRRVLH